MTEYLQVLTTLDKKDAADRMARKVVEKRMAACAQVIGPINSTYWWHGKVEVSEEWLCVMKTTQGLFKELEEAVKIIHSYEIPEIIAVPIVEGHADYLDWLEKVVRR